MSKKNAVSTKNVIAILCCIITGSNFIFEMLPTNQNDQWISISVSFLLAIPIVLVYSRIIKLCGQKSLFQYIEELFGKVVSKMIFLFFAFFAIHSASRSLIEFSETVGLTVLKNTPTQAIAIMIIMVCMYLAKSNLSTLGKMSLMIFVIGYVVNIALCIFALPFVEFNYIFPVATQSISGILQGSLKFASLSSFEIVFILGILDGFGRGKNAKKTLGISLILGYFVIIAVFLRTILLLGPESFSIFYFPRYVAIRLISLGGVIERIENFSYYTLLLAGIVKIVVLSIFSARSVCQIFGIQNYQDVMVPITFSVLAISGLLVNSIMEVFSFLPYYFFYSYPFQIIIPFFVWLVGEFKNWIQQKQKNQLQASV